jgi:lysophospholipase L1-like esterase
MLMLAVEGAVRLWLPPISSIELFVTSPVQRHGFTDSQRVSIFEGDPLFGWRLRPLLRDVIWDFTLVSTNEQRLRRVEPVRSGPHNGYRVACLGDSVTFGYRVPVVWAEHPDAYDRAAFPYPALLEQRLRREWPEAHVDVLPLAVPGYSSHQGLAWLRRDIRALRPQVVTACFGWNDVGLRLFSDAEAFPSGFARVTARTIVASSQALRHLVTWTRRASRPRVTPEARPRVGVSAYVENFREMARLSQEAGAAFVVIAVCYRDATTFPDEAVRIGAYRTALARAMAADGVPYLEIPELIESAQATNQRLFGEVIHPNSLGHRLMADRLWALLEDRGLLPSGLR